MLDTDGSFGEIVFFVMMMMRNIRLAWLSFVGKPLLPCFGSLDPKIPWSAEGVYLYLLCTKQAHQIVFGFFTMLNPSPIVFFGPTRPQYNLSLGAPSRSKTRVRHVH